MTITLPYPPTINTYWRTRVVQSRGGRAFATHYVSERGKEFRQAVVRACKGMTGNDGPLSVEILVYPPDQRKRDLDNIVKPLLDAMTAAGLWHDDSLVEELRVKRKGVVSGGRVDVTVTEMCERLF